LTAFPSTAGILAQLAVSGALIGLVYALVAYGFQLTFATSKSINFGQGELVMVSAFFSLTLVTWGVWSSGRRCGWRCSKRAKAGSC
jgi:branched-subunit amino acid ABC-type transport system permease component